VPTLAAGPGRQPSRRRVFSQWRARWAEVESRNERHFGTKGGGGTPLIPWEYRFRFQKLDFLGRK
jgi:hypothetical protein